MIVVLWMVFLTACGSLPFYESQKDLDRSIKFYNNFFEGKLLDRSTMLVHRDKQEDFMLAAPDFMDRVTFFESKVVGVHLFKDGAPVPPDPGFLEGGFDEAEVILRYRLVVSPSNTLKTLVIHQKWILENGQWFVLPDLNAYLNPK
ncbi:MAG: hypothetical protein IID18_02580 [Nitrospinae bacterium]|nr:hypothetical protein [Nitrospinota bacterium]